MKHLALLGIILSFLILPVRAQTFNRTTCPLELPPDFFEGTFPSNIECGFVAVPEFHADPNARLIEVRVAIIHSSSPNPFPDPVFMAQGGPGGSSFELFIPAASVLEEILSQRDIVIVEQRGTFYSSPNLTCPEVLQDTLANINQDNSLEDQLDDNGAYARCFERLRSSDVNLSAYNSVESAADIITVADALGYGQINFYGVSYGTMLGQHLLRDFEDRVRTMVLDAVVPLELNFIPNSAATAEQALTRLFRACQADLVCNARYPNLETVFYETVTNLNANPTRINLYDPLLDRTYTAFFSGDIFLQLVRGLQYSSYLIPSLPAIIYATAEEDYRLIEYFYSDEVISAQRSFADALYLSVICSEDADFTAEEIDLSGRREFASNQLVFAISLLRACDLAQVEKLPDYVDAPVLSDVPVLLLSGELDPITPPRYAAVLASHLGNVNNVTFPGMGHGVISDDDCPSEIVSNFIVNPTVVDTSCIQTMELAFFELATDPSERLSHAVPPNMRDVSTSQYASYVNAFEDLQISLMPIEANTIEFAARVGAETMVRPDFSAIVIEEYYEYYGEDTILFQIYFDNGVLQLIITVELDIDYAVIAVEISSEDAEDELESALLPVLSALFPLR